jgi:hypothetical protein
LAFGVKGPETRGWQTSHRGRIGIAATKTERPEEAPLVALPEFHDALWPHLGFNRRPMPASVRERLPRGAIVATAQLVECAPIGGPYDFRTGIMQGDEGDYPGRPVVVHHPAIGSFPESLILSNADTTNTDISDQLPFGIWEPGRWAWLFEDVKPVTERCPWCWGSGWLDDYQRDGCGVCGGDAFTAGSGTCEPVPARGMPGLWPWTP